MREVRKGKIFMTKCMSMGRETVNIRKGRRKGRVIDRRVIEKEEFTSTEFPDGGNTVSTKITPHIATGVSIRCKVQSCFIPIKSAKK